MSIACERHDRPAGALLGAEPTASGTADDLERLLTQLEWTLVDFDRTSLAESRSIDIAGGGVRFYHVQSGSIDIIGASKPIRLIAGDYLLLPRIGAHRIAAGDDAVVASGELGLVSHAAQQLVAALPDVLVSRGLFIREPHLDSLLDGLAQEFGRARGGTLVMRSRIATIIASAAVRAWVENGCAPDQWLVTVQDPHIARAVAAMQNDPGDPWTVESLARVARASRSVFTERFRMLVGDSPARYLTQLRMEYSKDILVREQLGIAEVALRLGYGSEAAFSRAFRRHVGTSPAAWRRQQSVFSAIAAATSGA